MPKGLKKRKNRTAGIFCAVRFAGAFRKSPAGVWASMEYEISNNCPERAAVVLRHKDGKEPEWLRGLGVLFEAAAVRRVFSGDCWSEYKDSGELHPTRNYKGASVSGEENYGYEEGFVKAGTKAVAILVNWNKIVSEDIKQNIESFACKNNMPIVECNKKAIKAFLVSRKGAKKW